VREALLAAAGGIVGVGQASVGKAAPHGLMTVFNSIRDGYLAHLALADATARAAALREGGPFNPAPVEPFKAGPGIIMVFTDMLERCLKMETTITVAMYYIDNEELSMSYFLIVFTGACRTHRLLIRRFRTTRTSNCMENCWCCSVRIFRPAMARSCVWHVPSLFSRLASLGVGLNLCDCMTCNVLLLSLQYGCALRQTTRSSFVGALFADHGGCGG